MKPSLDNLRQWFAEDLRVAAPVQHNESVLRAFAEVPRERFCGDGPWHIHPRRRGAAPYTTKSCDPADLYHDVLIAIDRERDLNIGQPSLWACVFDNLVLAVGQTVIQVGAGSGYYTAILAELVGPGGRVEAHEIDNALARRAGDSLSTWPWVSLRKGNGVDCGQGAAADAIIVFAGATHPAKAWLDRLAPSGRLLLPLTAADGWGFLLYAEKTPVGIAARWLGPCGFFPCAGARHPEEESRLQEILSALGQRPVPVRSLHLGRPPPECEEVWFEGEDYWLSSRPLPAS